MPQNIVQGLFGLTPDQIRQQQYAATQQQAAQFGQMSPRQQASTAMYEAGAGLVRPVAGMMGMVNPEEEQARRAQQIMGQGGDLQTPEGLRAKAQQFLQAGDQRMAYQLGQAANAREAEMSKIALEQAKTLAELRKAQTEASPIAKLVPKDYTKESWGEFAASGYKDTSKLQSAAEPGKATTSIQEYLYAKNEGYPGTFEQWKKETKAEGTTVKLPEQEKEFEKELGKGQAKSLIEGRIAAEDASQIINTVNEGRKIIAQGMVTGFGADAIVNIGQALKQAGIDFGGDATANSQAYVANMAQNVGKMIKQFGAGTGLSDADREYATKMAGGKITLDKDAIKKILDINEKAARNIIRAQNKRAQGIKTNIPLTVEEPTSLTTEFDKEKEVRYQEWKARQGK